MPINFTWRGVASHVNQHTTLNNQTAHIHNIFSTRNRLQTFLIKLNHLIGCSHVVFHISKVFNCYYHVIFDVQILL